MNGESASFAHKCGNHAISNGFKKETGVRPGYDWDNNEGPRRRTLGSLVNLPFLLKDYTRDAVTREPGSEPPSAPTQWASPYIWQSQGGPLLKVMSDDLTRPSLTNSTLSEEIFSLSSPRYRLKTDYHRYVSRSLCIANIGQDCVGTNIIIIWY